MSKTDRLPLLEEEKLTNPAHKFKFNGIAKTDWDAWMQKQADSYVFKTSGDFINVYNDDEEVMVYHPSSGTLYADVPKFLDKDGAPYNGIVKESELSVADAPDGCSKIAQLLSTQIEGMALKTIWTTLKMDQSKVSNCLDYMRVKGFAQNQDGNWIVTDKGESSFVKTNESSDGPWEISSMDNLDTAEKAAALINVDYMKKDGAKINITDGTHNYKFEWKDGKAVEIKESAGMKRLPSLKAFEESNYNTAAGYPPTGGWDTDKKKRKKGDKLPDEIKSGFGDDNAEEIPHPGGHLAGGGQVDKKKANESDDEATKVKQEIEQLIKDNNASPKSVSPTSVENKIDAALKKNYITSKQANAMTKRIKYNESANTPLLPTFESIRKKKINEAESGSTFKWDDSINFIGGTGYAKMIAPAGTAVYAALDTLVDDNWTEYLDYMAGNGITVEYNTTDDEFVISDVTGEGEQTLTESKHKPKKTNEADDDDVPLSKLITDDGKVIDKAGIAIGGAGCCDTDHNYDGYIGGIGAEDNLVYGNQAHWNNELIASDGDTIYDVIIGDKYDGRTQYKKIEDKPEATDTTNEGSNRVKLNGYLMTANKETDSISFPNEGDRNKKFDELVKKYSADIVAKSGKTTIKFHQPKAFQETVDSIGIAPANEAVSTEKKYLVIDKYVGDDEGDEMTTSAVIALANDKRKELNLGGTEVKDIGAAISLLSNEEYSIEEITVSESFLLPDPRRFVESKRANEDGNEKAIKGILRGIISGYSEQDRKGLVVNGDYDALYKEFVEYTGGADLSDTTTKLDKEKMSTNGFYGNPATAREWAWNFIASL